MKIHFIKNIFRRNLLKVSLLLLIAFSVLVMSTTEKEEEVSCTCGTLISIDFGPTVPGDNTLVTGQRQANCFAWSEFVALNWPTESGVSFGQAGNKAPVQWETYMTREVLLPEDGSAPPPWGSTEKAPDHMDDLLEEQTKGKKVLFHQSKFNAESAEVLDEEGQAFPSKAPNWLGAQNGTNLWYEVLVNEDEYNYIVNNKFYNAKNQYDFVKAGKRIDLPKGSPSQVGALELKASWMEVIDPENAKWNRYKLSDAILIDPQTKTPKNAVVALIGLHILHKTQSQPTWFWATFEHVDNVPGSDKNAAAYNLFNKDCQPQEVEVPGNCGQNTNKQDSTYQVGCEPNQPSPYYLCEGAGPVPMQVSREIPIDNDARMINRQLQDFIKENYPGSVWANYELINMIWSTTPQNDQNNRTPQGLKSMQPNIPVANSASETFIQSVTCFGCHQGASIAPVPNVPKDTTQSYASDFSFVFEFAGYKK